MCVFFCEVIDLSKESPVKETTYAQPSPLSSPILNNIAAAEKHIINSSKKILHNRQETPLQFSSQFDHPDQQHPDQTISNSSSLTTRPLVGYHFCNVSKKNVLRKKVS